MKLPQKKGICLSCDERDENSCTMKFLLSEHKKNQKIYGNDYSELRPDLWNDVAIDDPEFDKHGTIIWCPCFYKNERTGT